MQSLQIGTLSANLQTFVVSEVVITRAAGKGTWLAEPSHKALWLKKKKIIKRKRKLFKLKN
jgi:hypothetical protein